MKLSIVDPKKIVFDGIVDGVIVQGNSGQLAILENHIPIIVPIKNGYIKTIQADYDNYYVISGGILEHSANVITVIAQEVAMGNSLENAQQILAEQRKKQSEKNRQQAFDFSKMERDLALSLKEAKASKL